MTAVPNDPTMAGAPVPAGGTGTARLSLSEIEALAMKAARGAGMSWGMAEEAGFAARLLAAQGVPGAELLLRHLETLAGTDWSAVAPVVTGQSFTAPGPRALCPIALGAALADRASLLTGEIKAGPVACPALILPFAAAVARAKGGAVQVAWNGCRVTMGATGILSVDGADGLDAARCEGLTLVPCAPCAANWPETPATTIALQDLRRLDGYALQTTVPASEKSRQGAGAGTTDND